MQMLQSADLGSADQLTGDGSIGVQIAPDGSVQYVQQNILDTAQVGVQSLYRGTDSAGWFCTVCTAEHPGYSTGRCTGSARWVCTVCTAEYIRYSSGMCTVMV